MLVHFVSFCIRAKWQLSKFKKQSFLFAKSRENAQNNISYGIHIVVKLRGEGLANKCWIFWNILLNLLKSICVAGCSPATLFRKRLRYAHSLKFCKMFPNTFFQEALGSAASVTTDIPVILDQKQYFYFASLIFSIHC